MPCRMRLHKHFIVSHLTLFGFILLYALFGQALGADNDDTLISFDKTNILISPSTLSCPQNPGSSASCPLIDSDPNTAWTLPLSNYTNVSVKLNFVKDSSVIKNFSLRYNVANTNGLTLIFTLKGPRLTWKIFVMEDCRSFSQSSSSSVYINCIQFSEFDSPKEIQISQNGQFWAKNFAGAFIWWETFTNIELDLQFSASNNITQMNEINLNELQVYGWTEPSTGCNCHPAGVLDSNSPCTAQDQCNCNLTQGMDEHCIPFIQSVVPYGPIDGGTEMIFQSNLNRTLNISVTIGDVYNCGNVVGTSPPYVGFTCTTSTADPSTTMNKLLWITLCWRFSNLPTLCRRLNERFTYKPTPVILDIYPRKTFTFGGIPQTVTGQNLDSVFYPKPTIVLGNKRTAHISEVYQTYTLTNKRQPTICSVMSSTQMICLTPVISEQDFNAVNPVVFLEISMDGGKYSDITNLSTSDLEKMLLLTVRPNLEVQYSGTQNYDSKKEPDRRFLIQTASNTAWIQDGAQPSDYQVTVGGVPARAVNAASLANVISFIPPLDEPPASNTDLQGAKMVKLSVGYQTYTGGYINYKSEPNIPLIVGLCVGLGGAALLAAIIAIAVVGYRRGWCDWSLQKKPLFESVENTNRNTNLEHIPQHLRRNSYVQQRTKIDEFISTLPEGLQRKVNKKKVDYSCITLGPAVGKGNFGTVYQGTYRHNESNAVSEVVAIKTISVNRPAEELDDLYSKKKEFLEEAAVMVEFQHKNVLSLKAISFDNQSMPVAVLPFMEHGDLKSFISNRNNNLSVADLLKFGIQVSEGMEYLSMKKYIHRDLAARNCMIDQNWVVKVADFGFAKDVFEGDYYRPRNRTKPMPIKWMSIESLSDDPQYTVKTDVWSYGVLLWELITRGKKPYPTVDPNYMLSYLMQGHRLPKPDLTPDDVYNLMLKCWKDNPEHRPTFTEIKDELKLILRNYGHSYPEPGIEQRVENRTNVRNNSGSVPNRANSNGNPNGTNTRQEVTHSYLELANQQATQNDYLTTDLQPHN